MCWRPGIAGGCGLKAEKWCCQTGLNCRPLHYQWSALPLSYGSMPRIRESAPKGLHKAADPCHKAKKRASAASGRPQPKSPQSVLIMALSVGAHTQYGGTGEQVDHEG